MTEHIVETPADRDGDRRVLMLVAALLLAAFAVGAAVQTVFVFRLGRAPLNDAALITLDVVTRIVINLCAVALIVVMIGVVRLNERTLRGRVLWTAVIVVAAAGLRFGAQVLTGIYRDPTWSIAMSEMLSVIVVGTTAIVLALVVADARSRLRMREREAAGQALRATAALQALASEELRVRREVAENLHGTVQNRMLLTQLDLENLIARVRGGETVEAESLTALRDALADIREHGVREMSHLLYPAGIDIGAGAAIQHLARRIPATIAVDVAVDPELVGADSLTVEQRSMLVRATEEGITNALKHGKAGALRIVLARGDRGVELTVDDDGRGAVPADGLGSGLDRLAERTSNLGGELSLRPNEGAGMRLRLSLPA